MQSDHKKGGLMEKTRHKTWPEIEQRVGYTRNTILSWSKKERPPIRRDPNGGVFLIEVEMAEWEKKRPGY